MPIRARPLKQNYTNKNTKQNYKTKQNKTKLHYCMMQPATELDNQPVRSRRKRTRTARAAALDRPRSLGFTWDGWYALLRRWLHGPACGAGKQCNVPRQGAVYGGHKLGDWLDRQRAAKRGTRGSLEPAREARLQVLVDDEQLW